jgi:pyruvate dehydrogenase kinase 2/3/4
VRFAHRVAELENLPFGLSSKEQVQTVRDWYVESYDELKKFPEITSMADESKFTDMIKGIMDRRGGCAPRARASYSVFQAELRGPLSCSFRIFGD